MKIKSCKLFKILSCLLFGGVTLVSCATPLIVSCSDSPNNNSNNNQDNVDKFWWPKEVFTTDKQVWKCFQDYTSEYWENNMPSTIQLSSFKKLAEPSGKWDDSMSNITFNGFNKIKVYSNLDRENYTDPYFPNLAKDNPNKESCVELLNGLASPYFYFKDTGYKLKAYQTDKEPSIPVYEVYANINAPFSSFDCALYIKDLQDKVNNQIIFPSDTFVVHAGMSSLSNLKLGNFHLKFYIAKAVDIENLGGYHGKYDWYIDNSSIENAIDGFVENNDRFTSPPNDGNYDW